MRIGDILSQSMVIADALADITEPSKDQALRLLAARFAAHPEVRFGDVAILAALQARERLGSTGVGGGVAIPHAKLAGLPRLIACFARVGRGVAYEAVDKKPVHLLFALLVPEDSAGLHLKALARISRLFKNAEFRERLLGMTDDAQAFAAFCAADDSL
jgi:PTS system nitrogen regulatory IIA component